MMTDPIADLLTRIRNANRIKQAQVKIPKSKLKVAVVEVLQREGYVLGIGEKPSVAADGIGPQSWLTVDLKYGPDGECVIHSMRRVSKPGRRVYKRCDELKPVLNGLGIEILSTSRGVFSDREAREKNLGGEVIAQVH